MLGLAGKPLKTIFRFGSCRSCFSLQHWPTFITLTLLSQFRIFHSVLWDCWLGDRKGNQARKMLGVSLLVVTVWLELCTSYSFSCHSPPPSSWAPITSRMETFWYRLAHGLSCRNMAVRRATLFSFRVTRIYTSQFVIHFIHQLVYSLLPREKQEAQLMLTTGSTRLAVSRGQQTWYHCTCK